MRSIRPSSANWSRIAISRVLRAGQLLVDTGQGELPIRLSVSRQRGTVDVLSAVEPRVGAFSRVLPNGDGSEYLFTLFFAPDAEEAVVEAQMGVVGDAAGGRARAVRRSGLRPRQPGVEAERVRR